MFFNSLNPFLSYLAFKLTTFSINQIKKYTFSLQTNKFMNRAITPLQIVTPKNKRFDNFYQPDYYTLDVNGRSYSPENL